MKRDVALRDLSRDHHTALVQARELRRAAERGAVPEKPVADAFLAYWTRELAVHFEEEETVFGPALRSSTAQASFERMVADHAWLRTEVAELEAARKAEADLRPLMGELGRMLEDHVRFEESVLFEAVQSHMDRHELDHLHGASYTFRIAHRGPGSCAVRPSHGH